MLKTLRRMLRSEVWNVSRIFRQNIYRVNCRSRDSSNASNTRISALWYRDMAGERCFQKPPNLSRPSSETNIFCTIPKSSSGCEEWATATLIFRSLALEHGIFKDEVFLSWLLPNVHPYLQRRPSIRRFQSKRSGGCIVPSNLRSLATISRNPKSQTYNDWRYLFNISSRL